MTSDSLDKSLTRSVATESLADLLGNVSETALDSVIENGTLRDIPIIGMITGAMKASRDISAALFLRKIVIFLQELSSASSEDRSKFLTQFDTEEKQHKFGQTVLLLLERSEDLTKPRLIARLICAHIKGAIDYSKTMRLCAIVQRCYTEDLNLLRDFKDGTQGTAAPIAESLLSAGLLSHGGFDGGSAVGDDGGIIFVMNEYGQLLKIHALNAVYG